MTRVHRHLRLFFDILSVLGESPADFFREEPKDSLVYHEDDQVTYLDEEKGYRLKWLVPESNENEMEPVMIDFAAHGIFKTFEPSPAETFVYVVSGRVKLLLGEQTYVAKKGETIYFHATKQHQLVNAATGRSKCLLVATASYL